MKTTPDKQLKMAYTVDR